MTLTHQQISEIVEKYCDRVVDEMDRKSLEQIVYDSLIDSYSNESEAEIESIIVGTYGDTYYKDLVKEVTA